MVICHEYEVFAMYARWVHGDLPCAQSPRHEYKADSWQIAMNKGTST